MTDSILAIVELFPGWATTTEFAAALRRRATESAWTWARGSWFGSIGGSDSRVSGEWLRQQEVTSAKHSRD